MLSVLPFFFFQAEDGIRDVAVTGVQTCALPILMHRFPCVTEWSIGELTFTIWPFCACTVTPQPTPQYGQMVSVRVCRGNVGRIAPNAHGNHLSVLRGGLRRDGTRTEWPNCESQFADRPLGDARKPVHQGALRLAIHARS